MQQNFVTPSNSPLIYYGKSDLLGQIALEIANNPDSCFSKNALAWYNSLYSELSDFSDCRYQVEINEELRPDTSVDTAEGLFDLLSTFALSDVGTFVVSYIVNEALKAGTQQGKQIINDIRKDLTSQFKDAT